MAPPLPLALLLARFAEAIPRRRLIPEEADLLIDAWRHGVGRGEELGECWAYLGWTPQELDTFQQYRICPD